MDEHNRAESDTKPETDDAIESGEDTPQLPPAEKVRTFPQTPGVYILSLIHI